MDSLKRMREPIAWTALVVLAARVLVALVSSGLYAREDLSGGLSSVAALLSYRAGDATLVAVLTAAVAACVLVEPTRHARRVNVAALIVVGLSALVAVAFAFLALGAPSQTFPVDALDMIANVTVPVLCLIVLARLVPMAPKAAREQQPYAIGPGTEGHAPDDQGGPAQPGNPAALDPRYQPTWQPDVAAGAAWHSAGDAAAGAPASGWGVPGQQGGWAQPPAAPGAHAGPDQSSSPAPGPDQSPRPEQPPTGWGGPRR
jgi:hypothetical protein